jgi:predicted type IV restriction endonuclease
VKKIFLIIGLSILLFSCKKAEKLPEGILSEAEMVQVFIEMHLAEAAINNLVLSKDSSDIVFRYLERKIWEKLDVSDSAVKKSHQYYLAQPEKLDLMYTAVVDSLALREQLLKTSNQ